MNHLVRALSSVVLILFSLVSTPMCATAMSQGNTPRNTSLFYDEHRTGEFKRRVGFDEKLSAEVDGQLVRYDWGELGEVDTSLGPIALSPGAGRVEESGPLKGFMIYRFAGAHNDRRFEVEIVDAMEVEPARDVFIQTAEATTMSSIPYGPGPEGLGTVSAELDVPGNSYVVFWIYCNVSFKVQSDDSKVGEALARSLQDVAEKQSTR